MNADLCNIQNKLIKTYNFQVPIRFIGRSSDMRSDMYSDTYSEMYSDTYSDMYSDILSHKLAPFALLFSYWKKTDQIMSHCAGSLFYVANNICHSR